MAFSVNMTAAARRHLLAAEMLVGTDRRDVAAYLYGIAAECAVKAMMPGIGLRPKADHKTPDDPYFAHFPDLRTMLRDVVSRRRGIPRADRNEILSRKWSLAYDTDQQSRAMAKLAGPYMADGPHGYKKGKTYEWPIKHLGDAFKEVTPRSFLGLLIAAAKHGAAPEDRVLTAEGIRHGLREASKTRVDQLHSEFPWIKGVLAPLAGLLLPQYENEVFAAWKRARTVDVVLKDAKKNSYLPPFPSSKNPSENLLFEALKRIGVMFRRKDDRIDMPDLFRVAARLLKKGGTTLR